MTDISKAQFYSPANTFKNVSKYTGSLSFPTSLNASQQIDTTVTIALTSAPTLTAFYANFLELDEAIGLYGSAAGTTPTRWYPANVSGNFGVGIHINTVGKLGWIGCSLIPVVQGSNVVVTGSLINPYSTPITLDTLTVSFVFVDYALAN